MENKQTAINWLNTEVERLCNQVSVNMSWSIWEDLIKQAKEIEKQQIIQSRIDKYVTGDLTSEQYYNKYYGK
jgi:hypothetical protein